jgi:hypothetical protein
MGTTHLLHERKENGMCPYFISFSTPMEIVE